MKKPNVKKLFFAKEKFIKENNSSFGKAFLGKKRFLLKYIIIATVLYIIWIPLADTYLLLLLKTNVAYFNLVGYSVTLDISEQYFGNQGMFSSIPPFIALVLITPNLKPLKRLNVAMIIASVIFLIEAITLIFYLYYAYVYVPMGLFYEVMVYFLPTCRVAIPFLVWIGLAYKVLLLEGFKVKEGEGDVDRKKQKSEIVK